MTRLTRKMCGCARRVRCTVYTSPSRSQLPLSGREIQKKDNKSTTRHLSCWSLKRKKKIQDGGRVLMSTTSDLVFETVLLVSLSLKSKRTRSTRMKLGAQEEEDVGWCRSSAKHSAQSVLNHSRYLCIQRSS